MMRIAGFWVLSCFLSAMYCGAASAASNIQPIKAWDYPGGGSTDRLFLAAAAGDFDGDGVGEWAVMKRQGSQIAILKSPSDANYEIKLSMDVDLTNNELIGLAAGDLDNDGDAELIVLRNAPGGSSSVTNVLVYNFGSNWSVTAGPALRLGSGNHSWKGIAAGDFDGDKRTDIVVARTDTTSQLMFLQLTTSNTLVLKASASLTAGTPIAAIAAGDLNGDKRAEAVLVRQATGSDKDFLFYRIDSGSGGAWNPAAAGAFNLVGGTTHYPWLGVTIGEFDFNRANGKELVFYKNSGAYFHYQKYVDASTAPTAFGSESYASQTQHPWTGIAAGEVILNNGYDELVMVRQNPGSAGQTLAVCGDQVTMYNAKRAALQRSNFHFGVTAQIYLPQVHTANGLDAAKLKRFAEDNHNQTISIFMADFYIGANDELVSMPVGSTYTGVLDLLNLLKASNSPIKVVVNFAPEWPVKFYNAPNPGDSSLIGAAELGPNITDERTLFANGDPGDFVAWFKLLGIVGTKFPNLVGIGIDDFSHHVGASSSLPFSWPKLGKMIGALREQNQLIAFVPTVYYELVISPAKKSVRDYVDGYVFYTRNDKHKSDEPYHQVQQPPDVLADGVVAEPDGQGVPNVGKENMHGVIVLPSSFYAIGKDTMNEEIADFDTYVGNNYKLIFSGIYAMPHSRSRTLPTPEGVDGQMRVAHGNPTIDGVVIYQGLPPVTPMSTAVYNRFLSWFLLDDYFGDNNIGSAPTGWSVAIPSNTTCKVVIPPGSDRPGVQFTDNNTNATVAMWKSFPITGGAISAQFRFRQTNLRGQKMFLRNGSVSVIELATGSGGNLDYIERNGNSLTLMTIARDRWYTVKVLANTLTQRADIYVDGVLRGSGLEYRTATSTIDNIYFGTHSSTGDSNYTVYVDAVTVAYER